MPMTWAFRRYTDKWPWDISEYIRQLASIDTKSNDKKEINRLIKEKIEKSSEKYRKLYDEINSKYNIIIDKVIPQCDEAEIEIYGDNCLMPPFTKRPFKKIENFNKTNDLDKRATPIIGALRWALEKYTILYAALNFSCMVDTLLSLLLHERNAKIKSQLRSAIGDQSVPRIQYAKWFPPRIVFGGANLDSDTKSYRSSVVVADLKWREGERKLLLRLRIDPPPYVYLALRELGFAGREKAVISSLLGIAAVMLTKLDTYGGEAPVPLGRCGSQETRAKLCKDANYELAVDFIKTALSCILKV